MTPMADFLHIHLVGTFPTVLAVNGCLADHERGAARRAGARRPGEVTYGSGGNGTMNHLTGAAAGARDGRAR